MVYGAVVGNQTTSYPNIKNQFKTTNQHFHDQPNAQEPNKTSTFGKLYANSTYFMDRRLDSARSGSAPVRHRPQTVGGGPTQAPVHGGDPAPLLWSGRLEPSTYAGNGTFLLANGLTYSTRSSKPVKLVPYKDLQKTEYQAHFNRTAAASEHPPWVSGRAPFSVDYKSTGRFAGL